MFYMEIEIMPLHEIGAWIGNILFVSALFFLAKKHIFGFISQVLANLLYCYHAYKIADSPLFWISVILIIVNIYAIQEWIKDK